MNAATQNEMERLRKERDEHEQARTALEEDLGQVILERDEAFARGKQVFEDLRRVEAERDEYRDLADKWRDDWTAAMDQRDALSAHVERLREVLRKIADTGDAIKCRELAGDACDDTPVTSLARRDAETKLEALEAFGARNKLGVDALHDFLKTTSALHRQLEGGE